MTCIQLQFGNFNQLSKTWKEITLEKYKLQPYFINTNHEKSSQLFLVK